MLFFRYFKEAVHDRYVAKPVPHIIMVGCVVVSFFSLMFNDLLGLQSDLLALISLMCIILLAVLFIVWVWTHPVLSFFGVKKGVDFTRKGGLSINAKNPLVLLIKRK